MSNLGNPCFAMKAGLNTTRDLSRIGQCQGIIVGEKGYDWEIVSTHIREIPFPAGIFLRQAGFPETGADGGVLMKVIRDGLQMLDKLRTPTR